MSEAVVAGQKPAKSYYPWLVMIAVTVVNFGSIGYTLAGAGVYLVPQATELGVNPGDLSWWITLYGFGMAFVLLFTGRLWQKIDARYLYVIGFAGQMLAVTLMSQYTALWQFYISGICVGLFGGLYYMIGAPFMANKWFVKKSGMALGVMNAGTGLGGMINPLIIAAGVAAVGWRQTQLIYGIVLLVIIVPVAFFILRSDPDKVGAKPHGWTPEYEAELAKGAAEGEKSFPGVPFKTAIKSIAFWCLFLCAVAACFFGGFNNYYPTFVAEWGFDLTFGALLTSLAGICNFLGPITGAISDKIGARTTTIAIIVLIAVGWACWIPLGPDSSQAIIIVVMFMTSFQMVIVGVQLPLCAKEVFGLKDFEKIWSTMMIGVGALSSFAAPVIAAPYAATGSYTGSFIIGVIIGVIALATLLGMYGFGKKLKWED